MLFEVNGGAARPVIAPRFAVSVTEYLEVFNANVGYAISLERIASSSFGAPSFRPSIHWSRSRMSQSFAPPGISTGDTLHSRGKRLGVSPQYAAASRTVSIRRGDTLMLRVALDMSNGSQD